MYTGLDAVKNTVDGMLDYIKRRDPSLDLDLQEFYNGEKSAFEKILILIERHRQCPDHNCEYICPVCREEGIE